MSNRDNPHSFLGTGFKFPVQVDENTGRFKMSSYEEDIQEAVYIIINTRPGERPMRPAFGCRIYAYVFESMNYTVLSSMKAAVYEAIVAWEPRVREIEVDIDTSRMDEGIVNISISYVVRQTNNAYNLVYPFYLTEGLGAD